MKRGPREQGVFDTLPNRPAGIINAAEDRVSSCFAGIFNGCLARGHLSQDDSLKIGKAECEWDWRETWGELKRLGLIDWTEEETPNHPSVGGTSRYVHLTVTDKGREVRDDDMRWFRELMDARTADEMKDPLEKPDHGPEQDT